MTQSYSFYCTLILRYPDVLYFVITWLITGTGSQTVHPQGAALEIRLESEHCWWRTYGRWRGQDVDM